MARQSKWILPMGSAVLGAVIVTIGWFTWDIMTEESPPSTTVNLGSPLVIKLYSSIDDLSDDSDVAIVGTVKGVAQTGMDRGRDGVGTPLPYVVYEVEVLEVLKGDVDDDIYVVRRPPELFPREQLSSLKKGETTVLYLAEKSTKLAPTINVTDVIYVPLAFDNAVFDVSSAGKVGAVGRVDDSTVVVPRGTGPDMFPVGTTFKMSDIRDAIEVDTDEIGPVGNVN